MENDIQIFNSSAFGEIRVAGTGNDPLFCASDVCKSLGYSNVSKAISDHVDFNTFMEGVKRRNPYQPEFVQAVQEVAEDIYAFIADKEEYHAQQILRRIAEPDRVVSFRVCWEDDAGQQEQDVAPAGRAMRQPVQHGLGVTLLQGQRDAANRQQDCATCDKVAKQVGLFLPERINAEQQRQQQATQMEYNRGVFAYAATEAATDASGSSSGAS